MELIKRHLDPEIYRDQITEFVLKEYGVKVEFGRLRFTTLPNLVFIADKVQLGDDKFSLRTGRLAVSVSWSSVLKRQIIVTGVELLNPVMHLKRYENGKWNFQKMVLEGRSARGKAGYYLKWFSIAGGEVWIIDELAPDGPVTYKLINTDFRFTAPTLFTSATFSLKANLKGAHRPAKLMLDFSSKIGPPYLDWKNSHLEGSMSLKRVNPEQFRHYVAKFMPAKFMQNSYSMEFGFSGNPSGVIDFNGGISMRPKELERGPLLHSSEGLDSQHFEVRGNLKPQTLTFDQISIYLPEITLRGKMSIKKYLEDDPELKFNLDTSLIDISRLGKLVPPAYQSEPVIKFLQANISKGKFQLSEIRFEGPLSRMLHLDEPDNLGMVSGKMEVKDFELKLEEFKHNVEKINGVLLIKKDQLGFSGISATYGKTHLKNVTGVIDNISTIPFLKANLDADLDLKQFREELITHIGSRRLSEVFRPVKNLKGKIGFNFDVNVNLNDPKKFYFDGELSLTDVAFSHDMFDLPVKNLHGKVHVNPSDIVVNNITFATGSSLFDASGKISKYRSEDYNFNFRFNATGELSDFAKTRFYNLPPLKEVKGPLDTRLDISGNLDEMDFTHWLDLTLAEYSYKSIVKKSKGIPLKGIIRGRLSNGNLLKIYSGEIKIGKSAFLINGIADKFASSGKYDFKLRLHPLELGDLPKFLPTFTNTKSEGTVRGTVLFNNRKGKASYTYNLKANIKNLDLVGLEAFESPVNFKDVKPIGTASGTLDISGKDATLPTITGRIEASNIGFNTNLAKPLRNINGTVYFKGDVILFKDLPAKIGGAKGSITGKVEMAKLPKVNLTVDAQDLDFDDIFDTEKSLAGKKKKKLFNINFGWNVKIRSKNGNLRLMDYTDLNTAFIYYRHKFKFTNFDFISHKGKWHAVGDLYTEGESREFDGNLEVEGLNLTSFIPQIWPDMDKINGSLNAKGKFTGNGFKWERMRKNFSGNMEFTAKNGSLEKFKNMSSLFEVVNVTQLPGESEEELEEREEEEKTKENRTGDKKIVGLPYESITGHIKIKNGLGHTGDTALEGSVLRLSAVGDLNFADASVDMLLGVKPFTTVDKIVSSIPIVGNILTGKGKSLITAYYEVKGPMKEPVATAIPVESIGRNVFGIIKRILELPVEILTGGGNGSKTETD